MWNLGKMFEIIKFSLKNSTFKVNSALWISELFLTRISVPNINAAVPWRAGSLSWSLSKDSFLHVWVHEWVPFFLNKYQSVLVWHQFIFEILNSLDSSIFVLRNVSLVKVNQEQHQTSNDGTCRTEVVTSIVWWVKIQVTSQRNSKRYR